MNQNKITLTLEEAWRLHPEAFQRAVDAIPTGDLRAMHFKLDSSHAEFGLALAVALAERPSVTPYELLVSYERQRWRWTQSGHGRLRQKVADTIAKVGIGDLMALWHTNLGVSEETRNILKDAIVAKLAAMPLDDV